MHTHTHTSVAKERHNPHVQSSGKSYDSPP